MADFENTANFGEVLEIRADQAAFIQSLEALKVAYNEWVASLGQGGAANISSAGIAQTVANIARSIDEFTGRATNAIDTFFDNFAKAAIDTSKIVTAAEEANVKAFEEGQERKTRAAKVRVENEANTNLLDRDVILLAEAERKERILLDAKSGVVDLEKQHIEALAQEELVYKRLQLIEQVAAGDTHALTQATNDYNNALKTSQDILGRIQKETNSLTTSQENLRSVQQKNVELMGRFDLISLSSIRERIELLRSRLEAVNHEIAIAQQASSAPVNTTNKSDLEARLLQEKDLQGLLEKRNSIQSQLNTSEASLHRSSRTFFKDLLGNLGSAIASMALFQLEWVALLKVLDLVTEAIKAPFKVVSDGVSYLQNIEKTAYELAVPLQANVEFSKDMAENFKISQDAAKELIPLLQTKSLQSGLPLDQLENVFKALSGSGASQSVKTVRELAEFAEIFAIVLRASGRNALSVNSEISKLSELFSGVNAKNSLFLQTLHVSAAEWDRILATSKSNKDILEQLEPKIRPYLEAARKVGESQAVHLEQLKLIVNQLEGAGSAPFYELINKALEKLTQFFEVHQAQIIAGIKFIANWIKDVSTALLQLGELPVVYRPILDILSSVAFVFDLVRSAVTDTSNQLKLLYDITTHPLSIDKSWDEYIKKTEQSGKVTADLYKLLFSKPDNVPAKENPFNSPNILDLNIKGKPGPDLDNKLGVRLVNAEFQLQVARYKNLIENIKAADDELVTNTKEAVKARQLSHEEGARKIEEILFGEQVATAKAFTNVLKAAKDARRAIETDPNLASKERQLALLNFDKGQEALAKDRVARERAVQKEISAVRIDGINERNAIADEDYKSSIRLEEQKRVQMLAINKAMYDAGYLTKLEALQKEQDLTRESINVQRGLIENEIASNPEGTLKREQATNKKKELEQKWTDYLAQMVFRRIELYRQELRAKEQFEAQKRQFELQTAEDAVRLSEIDDPKAFYTKEQKALFEAKDAELARLLQQKSIEHEVAIQKNKDSEDARRLELELNAIRERRIQLLIQEKQLVGSKTPSPSQARIIGSSLDSIVSDNDARLKPSGNDNSSSIAVTAKVKFSEAVREVFKNIASAIAGADITSLFDKTVSTQRRLQNAASVAANSLLLLKDIISTYQQGAAQGGVLGGIGAVTSQVAGIGGKFGKALSKIPVIGGYLEAVGPLLSFIGGIFTASAKRIAEQVKKSFSDTVQAFQNGNVGLADTIVALEQQRQDAIRRLSGKKGGQDQLNQILPQFDQEIATLKKQQQDILTNFEDQLNALRQQSSTLSGISQQWASINKQVLEYIKAGGDAIKAAEFLSRSLKNIQQDAQRELDSANQQAIQDAITLNDLLRQKIALEEEFKKTEFDLLNADSLERKQAGSVTRGKQLADARAEYERQRKALDDQIDLQQKKVDKEREVFNLATDIDQLHRDDEALSLKALDDQIQKWKDLKAIVDSISFDPKTGLYSGTGILSGTTNNNTYNITINGSGLTQQQVEDSLVAALEEARRQGNDR